MAEYGYNDLPAVGRLTTYHNKWVDSYAAEAIVEFGVPLKRGTSKDDQVLTWADAITVDVVGISVFSDTSISKKYAIGDTVKVLTKGRIYVTVSVAVEAGEKAYITVTTGLFTNLAPNNLLVGKFMSSAAQDTVAILEINL